MLKKEATCDENGKGTSHKMVYWYANVTAWERNDLWLIILLNENKLILLKLSLAQFTCNTYSTKKKNEIVWSCTFEFTQCKAWYSVPL